MGYVFCVNDTDDINWQDGKKPLEVMLAQIRAIRANRFPGKADWCRFLGDLGFMCVWERARDFRARGRRLARFLAAELYVNPLRSCCRLVLTVQCSHFRSCLA